jgi:hypothetical protein
MTFTPVKLKESGRAQNGIAGRNPKSSSDTLASRHPASA